MEPDPSTNVVSINNSNNNLSNLTLTTSSAATTFAANNDLTFSTTNLGLNGLPIAAAATASATDITAFNNSATTAAAELEFMMKHELNTQPKFEIPNPHDAYSAYSNLTTMQVHPSLNVTQNYYYPNISTQPSYSILNSDFDLGQTPYFDLNPSHYVTYDPTLAAGLSQAYHHQQQYLTIPSTVNFNQIQTNPSVFDFCECTACGKQFHIVDVIKDSNDRQNSLLTVPISNGQQQLQQQQIQLHQQQQMIELQYPKPIGPQASGNGGGKKKPSVKKTTNSVPQRRQNLICSNCKDHLTTLWRRNQHGEPVCNACGLYYKLHGVNRPESMKKDGIRTRKRKPRSQDGAGPPPPVKRRNGKICNNSIQIRQLIEENHANLNYEQAFIYHHQQQQPQHVTYEHLSQPHPQLQSQHSVISVESSHSQTPVYSLINEQSNGLPNFGASEQYDFIAHNNDAANQALQQHIKQQQQEQQLLQHHQRQHEQLLQSQHSAEESQISPHSVIQNQQQQHRDEHSQHSIDDDSASHHSIIQINNHNNIHQFCQLVIIQMELEIWKSH
uniref:GATA-type domain-containing protein n=1 Tax=Panagrolaimus davidi TaxID=227884 RepID=A0A914PF21_9BILA